MAVARAAALNFASSPLVATDLSWPFSKASRRSSSLSSSIVGIVCTLVPVVTGGLATGDDGLEEVVVVLFHEGHKTGVAIMGDDQDALPGVLLRVRVRQDVQQCAGFDGHDDAFEGQAALSLQQVVLLGTPAERLHAEMLRLCVPFVITWLEPRRGTDDPWTLAACGPQV